VPIIGNLLYLEARPLKWDYSSVSVCLYGGDLLDISRSNHKLLIYFEQSSLVANMWHIPDQMQPWQQQGMNLPHHDEFVPSRLFQPLSLLAKAYTDLQMNSYIIRPYVYPVECSS